MRSNIPHYDLEAPTEMSSALAMVAAGYRPFAGGTDLMVLLEAGKLEATRWAGLWRIPELHGIEVTQGAVTIGALTTYTEIRRSEFLAKEFPALVAAAAETGAIANQNRGTLGGNIANASPAADSSPPLLVYDAELDLVSSSGARRVPYCRFHSGYKRMDLRPDELIARIILPRDKAGWRHCFRKVGTRAAQAIAKVSVAAAAAVEGRVIRDIRIAFGAVAEYPLRAFRTEDALRGASLDQLPDLPLEISPIDDFRSTAHYRRVVAGNLLREFLESLG